MPNPLTFRAGRDFTFSIGPLTKEDGSPVDLSGSSSANWWFAPTARSADVDVKLKRSTNGGGITIVPSTVTGTTFYSLVITLIPTDTQNVSPGNYYHEAEVKNVAGHDYTLETEDGGKLVLLPSLIPPL